MRRLAVLIALCGVLPAVHAADPCDSARGQQVFEKCALCHTAQKDAAHAAGPNLWGIVGRRVAAANGFAYSPALLGAGGQWDEATLDAFITDPAGLRPGTWMAFGGIKRAADRAALVCYLRSLRDSVPQIRGSESLAR